MGSLPQPSNSPLSQAANASYSGPMAGWMAPMQAIMGVAAGDPGSQIQQNLDTASQNMTQPSGMAPPPQPQSTPAPSAQLGQSQPQPPSQSNMAPITQQLQQAIQPGSSYVGQMGQPGNFASNMQQPLQSYYQNPYAQVLGGWR